MNSTDRYLIITKNSFDLLHWFVKKSRRFAKLKLCVHSITPFIRLYFVFQNERVNDKDSIAAEKIVEHENIEVERHVRQLSATIRSEPPSPISSSTPAAPPIGLQIKDTLKPQPVNLLDGTALAQTQPRGPTTPKFHLSVMTPQEKIDYSALIEQLGGQVFDTVYFNPECTHVVVGKPNR